MKITNQLEEIAMCDDFLNRCYALTNAWVATELGIESVESILSFMERHSSLDFGSPGPLVHYVEQFCGRGYEERLLASIKRKPTAHTIGMLNAVINGTQDIERRLYFVTEMDQAQRNPLADEEVLKEINRYLERLIE